MQQSGGGDEGTWRHPTHRCHPKEPSHLEIAQSKANNDEWNHTLIAALRSVTAGRQYPQHRCFHAGWVTHSRCIFCLHTAVMQQRKATVPKLDRKGLTDKDRANDPTSTLSPTAISEDRLVRQDGVFRGRSRGSLYQ